VIGVDGASDYKEEFIDQNLQMGQVMLFLLS
jgi:hypothetical protein